MLLFEKTIYLKANDTTQVGCRRENGTQNRKTALAYSEEGLKGWGAAATGSKIARSILR